MVVAIRIVHVVCEEGPFWGTPVVVTLVREVWGSQLKCLEKIPLQVQNKQVSNPLKLKGSLDTIYFLLRKGAARPSHDGGWPSIMLLSYRPDLQVAGPWQG